MTESRTLVLIPARMAATRLPGKPLLDIAGLPMIVQVIRRAEEAGVGAVWAATDAPEVVAAVEAAGGRAVMTSAEHQSGSDRIFEALGKIDPGGRAKIVVNVQGDLPTIEPRSIRAALSPLADPAVDIATIAAIITEASVSFLGFGDSESVSWGYMLQDAFSSQALSRGQYAWFVPPGVCIILVVVAGFFISRGYEEVFMPRLRGR